MLILAPCITRFGGARPVKKVVDMRSRLIIMSIALLALSVGFPVSAYASQSDDTEIVVNIGPIFNIVIHPDGPMSWTITKADLDADWTISSRDRAAHLWANANWKLQIQGSGGPYFDVDPNSDPGVWEYKPVEDIVWMNGGGSWENLAEAPVTVTTGGPGAWDSDYPDLMSVGFLFRILLSWSDDTAGYYEYDAVLFTLSANP